MSSMQLRTASLARVRLANQLIVVVASLLLVRQAEANSPLGQRIEARRQLTPVADEFCESGVTLSAGCNAYAEFLLVVDNSASVLHIHQNLTAFSKSAPSRCLSFMCTCAYYI